MWRNSTPRFASTPERRNENINLHKYFISTSGDRTQNQCICIIVGFFFNYAFKWKIIKCFKYIKYFNCNNISSTIYISIHSIIKFLFSVCYIHLSCLHGLHLKVECYLCPYHTSYICVIKKEMEHLQFAGDGGACGTRHSFGFRAPVRVDV